jgi:hypothetical protein
MKTFMVVAVVSANNKKSVLPISHNGVSNFKGSNYDALNAIIVKLLLRGNPSDYYPCDEK